MTKTNPSPHSEGTMWRVHHVGAEFKLMALLIVCAVIIGILSSSGAVENPGTLGWVRGDAVATSQ